MWLYSSANQGVRNVLFFLENLACFVFLKHPFSDSPFCLIYRRIMVQCLISGWFLFRREHKFRKKEVQCQSSVERQILSDRLFGNVMQIYFWPVTILFQMLDQSCYCKCQRNFYQPNRNVFCIINTVNTNMIQKRIRFAQNQTPDSLQIKIRKIGKYIWVNFFGIYYWLREELYGQVLYLSRYLLT